MSASRKRSRTEESESPLSGWVPFLNEGVFFGRVQTRLCEVVRGGLLEQERRESARDLGSAESVEQRAVKRAREPSACILAGLEEPSGECLGHGVGARRVCSEF